MLIRQRCLLIILLFISVCSSYSYDKLEEFKYNQNILLTGIVSGIPKLQDDQYEFIFIAISMVIYYSRQLSRIVTI